MFSHVSASYFLFRPIQKLFENFDKLLAHLSHRLKVSFCDHLMSILVCQQFAQLTPFNTFASRADPDQAAPTLFAYGNMIRYDATQVDLTSNSFVLCTNVKVYIIIHSGWSLA